MRAPKLRFLALLLGLGACSSTPGGGPGGTGTVDAVVDTGTLGQDTGHSDADHADIASDTAQLTDQSDLPDSLADDSGTDDDIAVPESDLAGFFDDVAANDATGSIDIGPVTCGDSGIVKGVACAPSATFNVAFAAIAIDVTTPCLSGTTTFHADVQADAKGAYAFNNVPPGAGVVTVTKGSFKTTIPVTIVGGQTADLTLPTSDRCFKANGLKLAVIQGDADSIETLLDDLGFAHDNFASGTASNTDKSAAATLLTDLTKMQKYDVIFLDCSSTLDTLISKKPAIITNIQAYVKAGHSLYASDWAWQVVEGAFPSAIEFWGDDAKLSKSTTGPSTTTGPRQGPGPTMAQKKAGAAAFTMSADIVDAGLTAVLGKASTTIYEDLGTWVVMQSPGTGTTVEVQGALTDGKGGDWGTVPLVVRFAVGSGHVVYTSFHNIAVKDAGGPVDDIKAILTYLVFTL